MTWKELVIYGAFIGIIILICFYFMARKDFSTGLKLTADEQQYLTEQLLKRNAEDCQITKTETGWKCTEMRTGRIFRVTYGTGNAQL